MLVLLLLALAASPVFADAGYSYAGARKLLNTYCASCHRGKAAAGGFDLARFNTLESMLAQPRRWNAALLRVREHAMPPKGAPAPALEQREQFVAWMTHQLRSAACADGVSPEPALLRRLNRNEYAATMRDLLNIHINAAHALPADGAGGEGFDNAAETLFVSPIHAEKYLEAAKHALAYGARDPKSRKAFMVAEPGDGITAEQAARQVLEAFLPRAFRRPAANEELERYLNLYRRAERRGFEDAILFALQGVLISPHFLFRVETPNPHREPRLVGDFDLASRLSYFLWGTMPDQTLFDLASQGKLQDPAVLDEQVVRMLKDPKALEFAERFIEQWLGTRELGRDIKPDPKLFAPYYDAELQSAIRYEPILFFQEVLAHNLPLLTLLEADFTILTNKLQRHYELGIAGLSQQPKRVELPDNSPRGGLLGMAAVLAVSSYPHRTSPVLRGKWVLDALLGTPPPPPPPDVPELVGEHDGASPRTLRERLTQHRQHPACASCHDRIDPIGFGLENYDVLGRWRTEDAGLPLDTRGVLPGGETFDGPRELKTVLLARKDLFLRNLTAKMLGYAVSRGLTLEDDCTVDQIVERLLKQDGRAHRLVREIVWSVPFRYQAGTSQGVSVSNIQARRQGDTQ